MERISHGRDVGFSNATILPPGARLVFISGEVGRGPDGKVSAPSFEAEVHQCFDNIGATLDKAGLDFADIAKLTVFLTDLADYATFARVRNVIFEGAWPASSAVQVAGLLLGARIEIEAIAVAGP